MLEVNLTQPVPAGPRDRPRAWCAARQRQDRLHRVPAELPGRHQRARLHGREVRSRRPHPGAGQRVGRARASTSTRSRRATSRPTTRRRCGTIPVATRRSSTGSRPAAGATPGISPARRSSLPRTRRTTCTASSSRSMAGGSAGDRRPGPAAGRRRPARHRARGRVRRRAARRRAARQAACPSPRSRSAPPQPRTRSSALAADPALLVGAGTVLDVDQVDRPSMPAPASSSRRASAPRWSRRARSSASRSCPASPRRQRSIAGARRRASTCQALPGRPLGGAAMVKALAGAVPRRAVHADGRNQRANLRDYLALRSRSRSAAAGWSPPDARSRRATSPDESAARAAGGRRGARRRHDAS